MDEGWVLGADRAVFTEQRVGQNGTGLELGTGTKTSIGDHLRRPLLVKTTLTLLTLYLLYSTSTSGPRAGATYISQTPRNPADLHFRSPRATCNEA